MVRLFGITSRLLAETAESVMPFCCSSSDLERVGRALAADKAQVMLRFAAFSSSCLKAASQLLKPPIETSETSGPDF
jgi:hypothetical protein